MSLFVKLDATWPDNPKIIEVGLDGAGLHAIALCIAKRLETDGRIHRTLLLRQGASVELVERLVKVGLFESVECNEAGETVVICPADWHDRNPSQGAIEAMREQRRRDGKSGNHRRWSHPGPVDTCGLCYPDKVDNRRSSHGAIAPGSPPDPPPIAPPSPESESESESESDTELPVYSSSSSNLYPNERIETIARLIAEHRATGKQLTNPARYIATVTASVLDEHRQRIETLIANHPTAPDTVLAAAIDGDGRSLTMYTPQPEPEPEGPKLTRAQREQAIAAGKET